MNLFLLMTYKGNLFFLIISSLLIFDDERFTSLSIPYHHETKTGQFFPLQNSENIPFIFHLFLFTAEKKATLKIRAANSYRY
jgi:hypothetical protein